jgi:hypothetical protein
MSRILHDYTSKGRCGFIHSVENGPYSRSSAQSICLSTFHSFCNSLPFNHFMPSSVSSPSAASTASSFDSTSTSSTSGPSRVSTSTTSKTSRPPVATKTTINFHVDASDTPSFADFHRQACSRNASVCDVDSHPMHCILSIQEKAGQKTREIATEDAEAGADKDQ